LREPHLEHRRRNATSGTARSSGSSSTFTDAARPQLTGVTNVAPGVAVKSFELARELLPTARRVAILRPSTNDFIRLLVSQEDLLASRYDLQVDSIEVRTREDVPGAIE